MNPNKSDKRNIHTLHPIDSFGIQKVSLSGIRVETLEDRIRPAVPFPHKHDFFQLMLIIKGSGKHLIDFKAHKVTSGQVYLMKPGQMHSWDLRGAVKGIIIEFNYQSLNALRESSRLIKDLTFSPDLIHVPGRKDFSELIHLAEMMMNESQVKRDMHDLSLQGYLTAFLVNILRLYQGQLKHEKNFTTVEKFRDLLEKNFKEAHGVDFYARELKISPKALTMQLTRAIGRPPRELIQERLLLEAKRYLAFSSLSIAEIGYELGFEDANYFTRFFRVHEKESPAAFRKTTSV